MQFVLMEGVYYIHDARRIINLLHRFEKQIKFSYFCNEALINAFYLFSLSLNYDRRVTFNVIIGDTGFDWAKGTKLNKLNKRKQEVNMTLQLIDSLYSINRQIEALQWARKQSASQDMLKMEATLSMYLENNLYSFGERIKYVTIFRLIIHYTYDKWNMENNIIFLFQAWLTQKVTFMCL